MFTSSWAHTDVSFDAEIDRADAHVVEVSLLWGETTLSVRHVEQGESLTVGGDGCDLRVGSAHQEGIDIGEVVRIEHAALAAESAVTITPSHDTDASIAVDGWPRERSAFELGAGHHAELMIGAFTLRLRVVAAARAIPQTWGDRARQGGLGAVALSFFVHASLVAALAFFMPALGADDSEAIDRDRIFAMKAMVDSAAARERDRIEEAAAEPSPANEGAASGGARAQNAEGAMGKPNATTQGHYAAKKTSSSDEVTLPRKELLAMAQDFGMIALLGNMPTAATASDAPSVPWGTVLNGMDDRNHQGNLWSQDLGDAFGFGLGLSGNDEGGGGKGLGIGMNDVGGLGRSLDSRIGNGKCLAPPCDGMGRGTGLPGGARTPKPPVMRAAKTEIEGGRLPAEVIQRIVRMNHGRFRNCYEAALRTNPSLGGRVAVRFVIGRDGAVSLAGDGGSDLPDEGVRQCVIRSFYTLSFPTPENGTVRVTYPLIFTPGE